MEFRGKKTGRPTISIHSFPDPYVVTSNRHESPLNLRDKVRSTWAHFMDSFQCVLNLTSYFRMRIDRLTNERHFHFLLLIYFNELVNIYHWLQMLMSVNFL